MVYAFNDKQPTIGTDCFIAPSADLIGDIRLSDDVGIWYHATLRADVNSIRIGERTNIQDNCVLHVTGKQGLSVGADCTVGHSAILHACMIEDGCLIGMGAIVLDGSTIGRNSIVAAGSLVPPGKSFPERSLIVGSPAKVVRQLSDEDLQYMAENVVEYCRLAHLSC